MRPAQPPCTENIFIPGQRELAYRRVAWDRLTAPEAAVYLEKTRKVIEEGS